jgi:hypothetical protein
VSHDVATHARRPVLIVPPTHGRVLTVEQRVQLQRPAQHRLEPNPALLRQAEQRARSIENRIADQITAFAGSMTFVYIRITGSAAGSDSASAIGHKRHLVPKPAGIVRKSA